MITIEAKTGRRSMIQARFTFTFFADCAMALSDDKNCGFCTFDVWVPATIASVINEAIGLLKVVVGGFWLLIALVVCCVVVVSDDDPPEFESFVVAWMA